MGPEERLMTMCLHCTGSAYEHLTSDQRIVYCGNCGWEHREARPFRPAPAVRRVAATPAKPTRRGA
jgi:hypothetical protein